MVPLQKESVLKRQTAHLYFKHYCSKLSEGRTALAESHKKQAKEEKCLLCQRNLFHPNLRGERSKYPNLSGEEVLIGYFSYGSDVLSSYEVLGMQNP